MGADAMTEQWPPEHYETLVAFEVAGDPKGAGSKDAIPLGRWRVGEDGKRRFHPVFREGGVPVVNVVDTTDKTGGPEWRADIRQACVQALDRAHTLTDDPIAVRVIFYGSSPQSRYGTGRNAEKLKDSADRLPHKSALADGTKLARALEDALNAVLWTDDRRVCDLWWSRRFGRHAGARVEIFAAPARFCDIPGEYEQVQHPEQLAIIPADDHDDIEALAV
jgi:Holliday junction resolvase RusA-like endonuclease